MPGHRWRSAAAAILRVAAARLAPDTDQQVPSPLEDTRGPDMPWAQSPPQAAGRPPGSPAAGTTGAARGFDVTGAPAHWVRLLRDAGLVSGEHCAGQGVPGEALSETVPLPAAPWMAGAPGAIKGRRHAGRTVGRAWSSARGRIGSGVFTDWAVGGGGLEPLSAAMRGSSGDRVSRNRAARPADAERPSAGWQHRPGSAQRGNDAEVHADGPSQEGEASGDRVRLPAVPRLLVGLRNRPAPEARPAGISPAVMPTAGNPPPGIPFRLPPASVKSSELSGETPSVTSHPAAGSGTVFQAAGQQLPLQAARLQQVPPPPQGGREDTRPGTVVVLPPAAIPSDNGAGAGPPAGRPAFVAGPAQRLSNKYPDRAPTAGQPDGQRGPAPALTGNWPELPVLPATGAVALPPERIEQSMTRHLRLHTEHWAL